ncbi:MAG TPA: HAMP domain-containing sensor histidine kinase [Bacteroidales bacterium]|nr:HAMP domain-containing sensor histidine kinase [Bacteroidales bacterium]
MNFNTFNLWYAIRLLIFAGITSGTTFAFLNNRWILFSFGLMLLIFSISEFIYYSNSLNRKIAFFFDAVKNDDTTLHFPENRKNKSLQTLHHSLNGLNQRISEIKIKSENRERFYQEMMKYSATGILAVDEKESVEIINNSALQLIGMLQISHMSLLRQKNEALYNTLKSVKPSQTSTIKILSGDELKLISIKVAMLNFGNKQYRIYSLYDIKAEIEENELDSWQKLIRVITHEIMNSIAPITSLSSTLKKFLTREGKAIEHDHITNKEIANTLHGLDVIEKTSKDLMHFVEDYRRLTKVPKPVFATIVIEDWLNRIIALNAPRLEQENIELKLVNKNKLCALTGDEKLLTQVVINLLTNAMDALKATESKRIIIKVTSPIQGNTKISFSDNGAGIAPEEIEKIFIPFYTTKEHGSGIGLSLSRQIMRVHKGSISAISVPGKNTTFTLSF